MLLRAVRSDTRLAFDGPTALQAAVDYRPNVMLLDIGLPGMGGFEVANQIRDQPTLKDVVLIALTGYGSDADVRRAKEAGFNHYLVKPADFARVQEIFTTVSERLFDKNTKAEAASFIAQSHP